MFDQFYDYLGESRGTSYVCMNGMDGWMDASSGYEIGYETS